MDATKISVALADVSAERDPTLKSLELAAVALRGLVEMDWSEVKRLAGCRNTVSCLSVNSSSKESPMNSKPPVPSIPLDKPISWEDWLRGRRARRETSQLVAPGILRRPNSSSDRRLRKLFQGERGLPFAPTEHLK